MLDFYKGMMEGPCLTNNNEQMETKASTSSSAVRKRKKFIRKVDCQICGDVANDHIHYGAKCCYSCRAFFRRSITAGTKYTCLHSGTCEITKTTRRQCQACRLAKCLGVGMSDTWVMTEEDKLEKKQAAEIKKQLKQQANENNQRNIDLRNVPLSNYLRKRAQFKQEVKMGKQQKRIKIEEETNQEQSEFQDQDYEQERIRHSSVSSSVQTPLSINGGCSDRDSITPSPPVLSPASHQSLCQEFLNPPKLFTTSMPATLSKDDEDLVNFLVDLEKKSKDVIPMSSSVLLGMQHCLTHKAPLDYKVSVDGYIVAVKRLVHFITKVDAFNMFTQEDRRALIGNNCHLAVNIKSARLLSPGNNWRTQLQLAGSNKDVYTPDDSWRIEYNQLFKSPWACTEEQESQYREMMFATSDLNMDEAEYTLFVLASMFDTTEFETHGMEESKELYTIGLHYYDVVTGVKSEDSKLSTDVTAQKIQITKKAVGEKELAMSIRHFYMRLLSRYLLAKHGEEQAQVLLRKYNEVLIKLKDMREILLEKSLQF